MPNLQLDLCLQAACIVAGGLLAAPNCYRELLSKALQACFPKAIITHPQVCSYSAQQHLVHDEPENKPSMQQCLSACGSSNFTLFCIICMEASLTQSNLPSLISWLGTASSNAAILLRALASVQVDCATGAALLAAGAIQANSNSASIQ